MTARLRLIREGATLTEAKRVVTVSPPDGVNVQVVKSNHVERRGGAFAPPVTVSMPGPGEGFSVQVLADGRPVGSATADGVVAEVDAEPWFGYYDIVVDAGDFQHEERLVATVVETDGRW